MDASAYNLSILKSRTGLLLPIKIRNERWPDRYIRSASSINLKSLMAGLARRALPSLTAELQEPAHLESEWSQELWALGDCHLVQRKSGQRVPPSRKHRIVLLWKAAPTLPSDNTPASQLPNDPEKYMCKNVHSLTRFQTHHRPADKEHGINRFPKEPGNILLPLWALFTIPVAFAPLLNSGVWLVLNLKWSWITGKAWAPLNPNISTFWRFTENILRIEWQLSLKVLAL